jgi:hypothetical protein
MRTLASAVVALLSLLSLLTECVPASEEFPPAGAAGFVTEPSAASRGEPFVTPDLWTLRFERIALRAYVSASPTESRNGRSYNGGSETYVWNGAERVELFAPGLSIETWKASLYLRGEYLGHRSEDDSTKLGVDADAVSRFHQAADDDDGASRGTPDGPFIVFRVHGEKEGRTVMLDLALGSQTSLIVSRTSAPVEVQPDSLVSTPLPIRAENLFASVAPTSALPFETVAGADTDGDRRVTAAELRAVAASPAECNVPDAGTASECASLLDVLRARAFEVVASP